VAVLPKSVTLQGCISLPAILKKNGIYTHLVSDHYHYWEDGGSTYHNRYNTWEIERGQEGDNWKGCVKDPEPKERIGRIWRQDDVNREYMQTEEEMPQYRTFQKGLEFINTNKDQDNWFLQIETFDPHEPFFSMEEWQNLYPHDCSGPKFDWPEYAKVSETPEQVEHIRHLYGVMMSMCDNYLGKVLDIMDANNMWEDTMLIVNTDHGYLLGEHGWWAKCVIPFYNEVAHTLLFIWDPRSGKSGEKRKSLVQTINLAPTLLDYFAIQPTEDMTGKVLKDTIEKDNPVREAALFGMHGGHINCTDGRYVYMLAPQKPKPETPTLFNYTIMPTHMRNLFTVEELKQATLSEPFTFTKEVPLMKIPAQEGSLGGPGGEVVKEPLVSMLFDLEQDPQQQRPFRDAALEDMMKKHLVALLRAHDAPQELYCRFGLD